MCTIGALFGVCGLTEKQLPLHFFLVKWQERTASGNTHTHTHTHTRLFYMQHRCAITICGNRKRDEGRKLLVVSCCRVVDVVGLCSEIREEEEEEEEDGLKERSSKYLSRLRLTVKHRYITVNCVWLLSSLSVEKGCTLHLCVSAAAPLLRRSQARAAFCKTTKLSFVFIDNREHEANWVQPNRAAIVSPLCSIYTVRMNWVQRTSLSDCWAAVTGSLLEPVLL